MDRYAGGDRDGSDLGLCSRARTDDYGSSAEMDQELIRIRDGSLTGTALWKMEGIVAFPSFHTVLAVVFIYVHRPPCKTFIPIAAINTMMLSRFLSWGITTWPI